MKRMCKFRVAILHLNIDNDIRIWEYINTSLSAECCENPNVHNRIWGDMNVFDSIVLLKLPQKDRKCSFRG